MSASYCRDSEGWGPTSNHRVDLTPCFESTILSTLPALLAVVAFIHRSYTLSKTGQPHNLGRTNWIYWSCQFFMTAAALVLLVRAGLVGQESSHSPASVLANISVAIAWLLAVPLNHFEHKYEIRSSTPIFSFYFISIIVSAITIRTMSALPGSSGTDAILYYIYFALIILGFIFESYPRGDTKVQQRSTASPYEKSNLLSRYWFFYLQHIIKIGYRKPLQPADVAEMMPQRIKTRFSYSYLSDQWDLHVQKRHAKGQEPGLLRLILKAYGWRWAPILIYRILASALTFVAPELMNQLLDFTGSYRTDAPTPVAFGIILSFGMFFSTIASALMEGQFNQLIMNMGIEARTALISMVYRKALRLSPAARNEQSPGDIQNHMSVDAERWSEALPLLPMWFSIPFEICIALWLLYRQLGWAAIAGAGTILVVAPIQTWIAAFFAKAKDEKLAAMDNRIRLLNEVLSGIKIVKLYGWESSFRAKVAVFRNRELAILRKIGVAFSFMTIMFSSLTLLMALVSFSIYASVGGPGGAGGVINAQTIFVSITLFGLLNRPIGMLSYITGETMGLIVATRRIQKYLLAEELSSDNSTENVGELPLDPSLPVLEVKDGVFAWDKEGPDFETEKQIKAREKKEAKKTKQEAKEALAAGLPVPVPGTPVERNYEATLKDINLAVYRGHLTAIVGRVGQGKTSLFNALIGDMYTRQGTVKISGRIAYAPQQPWIINATLKDNIIFGSEFDQEKYDRIVFAAGLAPDFAMLPAADQTEIGERGINLSGGQKQRVSLARAAYQDADIYLLDDPLSAVDAHVDQHLWKHLIGPKGLLGEKTRLLVTHGIHHLHEVDQIVVIKDGVITETGRYQELLDAKNAFYQLIEDYSVKQKEADVESLNDVETIKEADEKTEIAQAHALHNKAVTTLGAIADEKQDESADLVEEEEMMVGSIHWHVYKIYAKAATYRNSIQVLCLFAVIQACQVGTNTWLQNWVQIVNHAPHGLGYYMGIYAVLVVTYMLLIVWTSYTTMVSVGVLASKKLHNELLNNVLRLPMSFFDTTPVGRIINRFSSDFFSIDEQIPWAFHDMFFCGVSVLGSLIVIAVTTPLFLVILPPVFLVYVFLQKYYIASSRAFKRIESISKSPMYQHFSETLSGVSTIRAMRCNDRFIAENAAKADLASNAHFVWAVGNRWLNVYLETLGSFIVLAASLFAVLGRDSLNSSMVGMSLSYALNLNADLSWLVRCFCELQNELVGVERVKEYSEKNQEAPNETTVELPQNWPSQGRIVFKNYSTRYRQGMDLVIKNVSFEVMPGEKVGIVGRTGAGKSSLTLAIFRIIEAANGHWAKAGHNGSDYDSDPAKIDIAKELEKVEVEEDGGSIEIDGVDISTIGLEHLRQHLAIIPQDPTLFVGTVRDNLDPFEQVEDFEIWEALERAHLKEYISSMPGGLSYEVTQNGENFSVGQRSLICLARALLRKTKILILDEATAAVDVETDELIQKTIRKEFKDRTILTIAHRIKTVMDSDKILVLERGRVEEYDAPTRLMQRKDSLFYKLAEQAGEVAK